MSRYTGNVGKKFLADGSARVFPGNTIICHVPPDSETFKILLHVREELLQQPWAKRYAFLPPSSYHSTVFEGVCDQVRKQSHWTKLLPIDAPLEQVDDLLLQVWSKIPIPSGFEYRYKNFFALGTIGIRLEPVSDSMNKNVRDFRDLLAEITGIRQPGHDRYGFHITFAYQLEYLTFRENIQMWQFVRKIKKYISENLGTFVTKSPELTFFTDMTNFAPSRAAARSNVKE
jgi:hypothetical protein